MRAAVGTGQQRRHFASGSAADINQRDFDGLDPVFQPDAPLTTAAVFGTGSMCAPVEKRPAYHQNSCCRADPSDPGTWPIVGVCAVIR